MALVSIEIDEEELKIIADEIGEILKKRGDKALKFKDAGGAIIETVDGMIISAIVGAILKLVKGKQE